MLQLVGYRSWAASGKAETIELNAVNIGIRNAREQMIASVVETTWSELSPGDQAFIEAMLMDEGVSKQRDLGARLGNKPSSYVSNYKKRLLRSGIIEEPNKGELKISLPGLREYVEDRGMV